MPYLNWRSGETRPGGTYRQEVIQEIPREEASAPRGGRPPRPILLRLTLGPKALEELVLRLEELQAPPAAELRVDLPEGWILFWKKREEESRLLIAHPQPGEWVATAALEPGHGSRLIAALRRLGKGDSHPVSQGGRIGKVSNLEIVIAVE